MKWTVIQWLLLLVGTGLSWANPGLAQALMDRRITLSVDDQPVRLVLRSLEQQTGTRFMYRQQLFDADRRVHLQANNERLGEVLDKLLKPLSLQYELIGKRILITRKVLNSSTYGIPEPESETNLAPQERVVTGKVTDEKNAGLPGANLVIKGTNRGTSTDNEGNFRLAVPDADVTLTVSSIGFTTTDVQVAAGRTTINVQLVPSAGTLSEVVVLGYTTARRQDLTGAVAVVEPAVTKVTSSGNPMQALQGRVPGLYVEKTGTPSGNSDRVLIRGANTLGNTDPLYIIDGVPSKRSDVFQSLNPTTIQSIQVLKDASAASIYGARSSNGVIVVTTSNGSNTNGRLNVQFNSSITAQTERPQRFKMLNSVDRGRALWQASVNDKVDPAAGYGEIYTFDWNKDFNNPRLTSVTHKPFVGGDQTVPVGDTDWQDVMYKTAYVTNNELTLSGGTKSSSLLASLSHFKNTGMLQYTGYERFTGRINTMISKFDGRFRFGMNVQATTSKETPTAPDIGGTQSTFLAITLAPTIPVYTTTGDFGGPLGSGYTDRNNPLAMQFYNRWDYIRRSFLFGNAFTEVEPIRNLVFRTSLGLDYSELNNRNIEQSLKNGFISRSLNSLTLYSNRFSSLTWTNTLRYNLTAGSSQFNVLAGIEAINDNRVDQTGYKENFAVQTEDFFTLSAGTGNASSSGSASGSRLLSQFARLDYNFSDRYLASVTLRRDGSSRFGPENRYGFFPAASVAWRLDQESFMRGSKLFSLLKLRVGAGRIGNQDIGDLARFGLFEPRYGTLASQVPNGHHPFFDQFWNVGTAYDLNGTKTGNLPSGFVQTQGANNALRWETTEEINAGLDFSLLGGNLTGSFDYFTRRTNDILIRPPVASAVGEGQLKFVNGATKTNQGFELSLGYYGKQTGDLRYSVSGNVARFRDRITVLPEEVRSAYAGNAVTSIIGHSQFDIFGYRTDGLFQSQAEVDAHAKQVGAAPGRIRYRDLNGDGKIDALDQEFFGTTLPAFEYGLRVDLAYKGFDVQLFGSGIAGRTGTDTYTFYNNFIRGRENVGPGVLNAWSPQNTASTIPALTLSDGNNETRPSDYFLVNTAYFKLRNLQVGYSINRDLISRIGLTNLRLYLMGENLFWLKSRSFRGPDPERTYVEGIPVPTAYTFGLNISF